MFTDTLLIVESIGIHIESKRVFGIFTSTEFLLWDTVEDIFIGEVIKGVSLSHLLLRKRQSSLTRKYFQQRVLYCLTIIVRESVGRQDSRRLVPLFQDLLPERKCLEYMYIHLANLIGSTKRKSPS